MKKILSLLLAVTVLFSSFTVLAFPDIDENTKSWAGSAINFLSDIGVINGYTDGTYRPNNNVTRAEFAKILASTFSLKESDASYTDISGHWAEQNIIDCGANIYTTDNAFYPEQNATRGDIAYALASVLQLVPSGKTRAIADISEIKPDMKNNIVAAVEAGLVKGYEDATIRPNNPVTRAEAAVLVYRALKSSYATYQKDDGTVGFIGDTVGKVGDVEIKEGELKIYTAIARSQNFSASDDEVDAIAKEMIENDEKLIAYAKQKGLVITPDVVSQIDKIIADLDKVYSEALGIENGFETYLGSTLGYPVDGYRRLLELGFLRSALISSNEEAYKVSDKEAQEFYNANKERFLYNGVTAKHILIKANMANASEKNAAKRKINEIYNKITKGEDFDALMNQYCEDPGVKENPDGYTFTRGEMVEEFEKVAFSLKDGEISEPFESTYGFHIIKLVEKLEYLPVNHKLAQEIIVPHIQEQKLNQSADIGLGNIKAIWY